MAVLNGTDFLLYQGDTLVGHTKETSVNIAVDLPDATSKSSQGFKEVIAGVRSGGISCSGFTVYGDDLNFEELAQFVMQRTPVEFYFQSNDFLVIHGDGFVESVEEVADMDNAVSYDLEIKFTNLFVANDLREGDEYWEMIELIWNEADVNWESI